MAEDSTNHLKWYLQIDVQHKDFLAQIRHWDNLKVGILANKIWIKDFKIDQLENNILKSIPFVQFFYAKDQLLFPKHSLLPSEKLPNILWTPIERALPIENATYNHNYFGLNEIISIRLIQSDEEKEATYLMVDIESANHYISNAPAIRLQTLKWILIDENQVLICGAPLLPINGTTYWQNEDFILPVGYNLEFAILQNSIKEKLQLQQCQLIWWIDKENYSFIDSQMFKPLSIASWRQTFQQLDIV